MHSESQVDTRSPATRVERRRAATRDRILTTAARAFAVGGPDAVRLDELAEAADVARGTLYSHFRTKEALLGAIVAPVLDLGARRTTALAKLEPRQAVEGLLNLYLELWHAYPDALRIAYKAQDAPIGEAGALHLKFVRGVMRVFEHAGQAGVLRAGDPALAGHVLRQVAVPLLELYGGRGDADRLFLESLRSLLLTDR